LLGRLGGCLGLLLGNQACHRLGTIGVLLQLGDLFITEGTPCTSGQIAELDGTFTHADEAKHVVSKCLGNTTYLALAPFVENNFDPRASIGLFENLDPCRCGGDGWFIDGCSLVDIVVIVITGLVVDCRQLHTIAPLAQVVGIGGGIEQDTVFFFDLVAGVGQRLGNVAVIGQQNQPFAGEVEPTDQMQALWHLNHLNNGWATLRVLGG
jgi:hypothetical protein